MSVTSLIKNEWFGPVRIRSEEVRARTPSGRMPTDQVIRGSAS